MIKKLTAEQEALLPVYRDKWLAIGLSTEPIDFEKAKTAVCVAYESVGLPKPTNFYTAKSPVDAIRLIKNLSPKMKTRDIVSDMVYGCHDANWLQLIHDSNVGNLFDENIIEKINGSNWPKHIYRPDSQIVGGYVLNNEVSRSIKRRLYAIMLRTHAGVWIARYLRRFLKYVSEDTKS